MCGVKKLSVFLLLCSLPVFSAGQDLYDFKNPPDEYRPWIFWDWINDMVSKKGIRSDLEQFKKFGLSGTLVMLVGSETTDRQRWEKHHMPNPIISQTTEFFNTWKFAAEESARLGLTISSQLGPGWCHSGGPWVKPEQAVQHIAHTEVRVTGNNRPLTFLVGDAASNGAMGPASSGTDSSKFSLPRPGREHFTSDITILAFPDKTEIPVSEVIDLSALKRNGAIVWKAPPGNWIVRRYAIRNALAYNRPAPKGGKGFECDKLDKDAVSAMFDSMVGRYLRESPALAGKTIRAFEADSWEVGNPEWTGKFRDEFIKRRGYDPSPWLVSYKSKQIVGNKGLTERFNNDMYLTQTDLFADNFFTHLSEKADSLKMEFMTEPYVAPFDPIRMAGRVQVPMCEFWVSTEMMHTARWASSAANTYGRKKVAAEAFTGRWNDGNWTMDPYAIKRVGDLAFCNGVNKMILHGTALQPWGDELKPGMNMFFWGTMFVPGQTWWAPGRAWVNYISRCQYMLSQGKNVADVVGLMPTLNWKKAMPMGLHKKYNYDLVSEELFIKEMDYDNGFFHLPSGARYRILMLPKTDGKLAPEIIEKLIVLVKKGGTVVCEDKPAHSTGLTNYPQVDTVVQRLAGELWGNMDGRTVVENKLGKGRLLWLNSIWLDEFDPERKYFLATRTKGREFWAESALTTRWSADFMKVLHSFDVPDVEILKAGGTAMAWGGKPETIVGRREGEDAIAWTHRRDGNTDIYFLSNQVDTDYNAALAFRIKDKIPYLWDAVTGRSHPIKNWKADGNRITLTIPFSTFGSAFVVFKPQGASFIPDGQQMPERIRQVIPVNAKWQVSFPPKSGAPAKAVLSAGSWSDRQEFGIKHFSGTATYSTHANISARELRSGILLDLGVVRNLVEIIVNHRVVDTLWCPPFRTDITKYLTPGKNLIELKITNTWWNRMVGDEQLPEDLVWSARQAYAGNDYRGYELMEFPAWVWTGGQRPSKDRISFTPWKFVEKDSKLEPSGLIGPVKLLVVDE